MLNRISELSRKRLRGSTAAASELGTGPLESLVDADETVQYVLTSASGIEHTTDGRTTTIEPEGDHAAYAVVTDHRLCVVLGDDPTTAEITVELGAVERTERRDGLLSTTLVFRTDDAEITFEPSDSEQADAAERYVDRVGSCWSDLDTTLDGARDALAEFEAAIEAGSEADRLRQQVRSRLSKAHHCATRADDAPTAEMQARIRPVEERLERLCRAAETDEIEALLDDGREAADADEHEATCDALVAAHEAITDARGVVDDDEVQARLDEFDRRCSDIAETFLDDAEAAYHDALGADNPAAAVDAWDDALGRYRAALAADWDGVGRVSADALRFQLAWVVQRLVDALTEAAAELEAEGDHHDDADRYEAALDRLERARTLATEHPHATGGAFDERIETLDEKIERAQWQWGSAD